VQVEPFEAAVDGVVLRGHRGGSGAPALLLHGGAAVPDYLGECAEALDGLFATIRYTQRGTPPSDEGPPYTVERHAADAVALLDHFGLGRAWVVGHSWGGHLALHLLVSHPERLLGALCVDPLGADPSVFAEQDANLRRGLSERERARVDEVERRRRDGIVAEVELVERLALIWPQYFARPESASPPPSRAGVQASIEVNRSLVAHFERATLRRGLPSVRVPVLFVHGERDPLPVRSTEATAALIPNTLVETIPDSGHFPWLEQPQRFRAAVELLLRGGSQ
jgi:pimeloyl-ACP methyl ester carboxylesterase